jgi:hypothetical protein
MKEGEHRPVIVIPTNRPEQFKKWVVDWKEQLQGCHLIVIEDTLNKSIIFTDELKGVMGFSVEVFDWVDINKDLGKDSWIIPRKTDCIRSYGFLKALEHNPLFILTLDDDTRPEGKTIEDHYKVLYGTISSLQHDNKYYNTMNSTLPRGHFNDMYSAIFNNVVLSHGIWLETPDLDAHIQLTNYKPCYEEDFNKGIIPKGSYFSMCGMNIAFKPEITKYLYFGLQGKDYPIDRCGDIWAGYFFSQRINEDKSYIEQNIAVTGLASVSHLRASNVWTNLRKEMNANHLGIIFREYFCEKPEKKIESYIDEGLYFIKLREAYDVWERLCNERLTRK